MKHFYAFLLVFIVLVSCVDIKTDSTLIELNKKTELYNAYKNSNLKNQFSLLERTSNLDDSFKDKYDVVASVEVIADGYFYYLDSVKSFAIKNKPNSGKGARLNPLQKEFFNRKVATKKGRQFLNKMAAFKKDMSPFLEEDYPSTKIILDSLFNTNPVKISNNGEEDYLAFQFKGVSNATVIANLTLMQSNVLAVEIDLMSKIMGDNQLSSKAYRVDVVLEKTKFYPGEKVRGKLLINKPLGNIVAKDVVLNGAYVDEKFIKNGEVDIVFTASKNVGNHPVEGELTISQGESDLTLYFNQSYSVIGRPKVRIASKKNKKQATIVDTKPKINKVNYSKLPIPEISLRDKFASGGVIKLTKSSFRFATIDAVIPGTDLKTVVTEFSFKPSSQPTIKIYGNKLTIKAISVLNKSKRGRQFKIFNVRVKLKEKPKYHLKTPLTVNVEIMD